MIVWCLVPAVKTVILMQHISLDKYEYGMNPLTVTARAPRISTLIGAGRISSRGSMPALITTFSRRMGGCIGS